MVRLVTAWVISTVSGRVETNSDCVRGRGPPPYSFLMALFAQTATHYNTPVAPILPGPNKKELPEIRIPFLQISYPLTAKACVNLIVTDLAVIEVMGQGLLLRKVAPGWTADEVQALTEPKLAVAPDLKDIEL